MKYSYAVHALFYHLSNNTAFTLPVLTTIKSVSAKGEEIFQSLPVFACF
jgi:hypothetical protein